MTVAEPEQIVYRIEHELAHHSIEHCTIQTENGRHPHKNKVLCSQRMHEHHRH